MTGTLAQQISLISHGNAFLRSGFLSDDYFPNAEVFKYCNSITFFDLKKQLLSTKKVLIGEEPNKWFEYLKQDGCISVRLYYQPTKGEQQAIDHNMAGFLGGGGLWQIEAIYTNHSDFWTQESNVTQKDDPDNKIWSDIYVAAYKDQKTIDTQIDLAQTHSLLEQQLLDIADFAFKKGFTGWGETFDKARNVLKMEKPAPKYYQKGLIVERNYSLLAKQLLFGAMDAWVFGGMGSWNDMYLEEKNDFQLYNSLSLQLYRCVNQGIMAAINTY